MVTLSFLDLPPEVRNYIYEQLFDGAVIEDHGFSPSPITLKNYHWPITTTCHQVRDESLAVLRSETTLYFRLGVAGTPPIPSSVLVYIRKIRMPVHRLETLDVGSFTRLETLILDVSIDAESWKVILKAQARKQAKVKDISDMIHISMTLGMFQRSWDLEKLWRDPDRHFKILCWVSSWARDFIGDPVLVDLDRGLILDDRP